MPDLLERIRSYAWNKDIRNAVIAALLVTGFLGIWKIPNLGSKFTAAETIVRSALIAAWVWLTDSVRFPQRVVWLTLITFAALVWWLIEQRRRAVKQIADRSAKLILDAVGEAKKDVRKAAVSQLVKNAKASMELTANDKLALSFIYGKYPASLDIRHVAGLVFLQYPAAERLCEKLEAHGLVKCIPAGHNPASVLLTKPGRDYCIENELG
jgi:hypothetical protein